MTLQVAYLGRLIGDKGLDHLLVVASALRDIAAVRFVCAGSIPKRAKARDLRIINELSRLGNVTISPPLNREEKYSLLDRSDVGLLLSRREGCSRWMLEVVERGKIFVGYRTSGNLIVEGFRGVVLIPKNDIAGVIEQLLSFTKRNYIHDLERAKSENRAKVEIGPLSFRYQVSAWSNLLQVLPAER